MSGSLLGEGAYVLDVYTTMADADPSYWLLWVPGCLDEYCRQGSLRRLGCVCRVRGVEMGRRTAWTNIGGITALFVSGSHSFRIEKV